MGLNNEGEGVDAGDGGMQEKGGMRDKELAGQRACGRKSLWEKEVAGERGCGTKRLRDKEVVVLGDCGTRRLWY